MIQDLKSFFSLFKSNTIVSPTQVVGIDMGSSSVKVVELQKKENVITLKTYGELQIGPYGDRSMGMVTKLELSQKIEALVDVLRESKVTAPAGVIALPLASSFVTVFSLPSKEHEDISSRIRIEARKYIPIPMTEITLDWSELPALGEASNSVKEILVAAVQNDAHTESQALLGAINMKEKVTEIEIFSTLRAISNPNEESLVIIDLGAQTSKMFIAHQGSIRKIHRVFAGGVQATDIIRKQFNISFDEAENKKRNYAKEGADAAEIKKAMVTTFERPLQEFKRVLNQYELRTGSSVSRIVVTGGSASFLDMQTYINYMLDRTVERANPFTKIAYPAFLEDMLENIAPVFSVALGAALRPLQ